MPQSTISESETGNKEMTGRHLCALAKTLKVRPEWLQNNEGDAKLVLLTQPEIDMLASFDKAEPNIKHVVMAALFPHVAPSQLVIPKRK